MKPLRKGAARTALTQNMRDLLEQEGIAFENMVAVSPRRLEVTAAVLGGAIEATLDNILKSSVISRDPQEVKADFWRILNHNAWDLTRTLKASGLLDQIK